jgi:hypothetical protein
VLPECRPVHGARSSRFYVAGLPQVFFFDVAGLDLRKNGSLSNRIILSRGIIPERGS